MAMSPGTATADTFVRITMVGVLLYSWLGVFNPRFRGHYKRSRVPVSLQSSAVLALGLTAASLAVFRFRSFVCANVAIISFGVRIWFWHHNRHECENGTIRLSLEPVQREQGQPDQFWVVKTAAVAILWLLSFSVVVRDIYWPSVSTDAEILRWIARVNLGIFSAAGLVLYIQRPKKNPAAQSGKSWPDGTI